MKQIKIIILSMLCWSALQANQQSFIEKLDLYLGQPWNINVMNTTTSQSFERFADMVNSENRHFIIQQRLVIRDLLLELAALRNIIAATNGYTQENAVEVAKIGLKLSNELVHIYVTSDNIYQTMEKRRLMLIDALMELHKDFPSAKIF